MLSAFFAGFPDAPSSSADTAYLNRRKCLATIRLALPANLKDAAIFVSGRRTSPPLTARLREWISEDEACDHLMVKFSHE